MKWIASLQVLCVALLLWIALRTPDPIMVETQVSPQDHEKVVAELRHMNQRLDRLSAGQQPLARTSRRRSSLLPASPNSGGAQAPMAGTESPWYPSILTQ